MEKNSANTKKVFIYFVLALIGVIALVAIVFIVVTRVIKPSGPSNSINPPSSPATTNSSLGETQAVEKVKKLDEVQEFLKTVPGGIVEVDRKDKETNSYVVHVYEIKDGHTATFNWYNVNKETGEITAEFDFEKPTVESPQSGAGGLTAFTNSQYGIELQYPKDWTINKKTQIFEKGDLATIEITGKSQTSRTDFFDGGRLALAVPFKATKNAADWAKGYYSKLQQKTQYSAEKLAGIEFVKVDTCGEMGCATYYHTKKGGLIYGIFVFAEGEKKAEYQQAISQMLQTLKLTK